MPPMIHDGVRGVGDVARPFTPPNIRKIISGVTSPIKIASDLHCRFLTIALNL